MNQLRNYLIVTGAYWSFMLTDGALRMLALLYFHERGYSPVKLAFLFLLYEFFGIVTNLFGGWLANRFGLKSTLVYGLFLQTLAMFMLSFLNADWPEYIAVAYVMGAQALSGIAKDLTKMSSKTAIKFLIPEDKSSQLFKWVAVLTGSKNAIKGAGFFLGAFLLETIGFLPALHAMGGGIFIIGMLSQISLPNEIGKEKVKNKLSSIFSQGRNINVLSLARMFLFGARDIWFVVGLPVFLHSIMGWSFTATGTFMALWVIAYGAVQAAAPKLVKWRLHGDAPDGKITCELSAVLGVLILAMAAGVYFQLDMKILIIGGLYLFGLFFALNSSVHSFLIIDYADGDKAAINVGFYYMANAAGRLLGTLCSGLFYQFGGLMACLVGSGVFLVICTLVSLKLPREAKVTEKFC